MDSLARTLLDLSPASTVLLRPLYDAQQLLVDFAYEQLNPAAQRQLQLPAQPPETLGQLPPLAADAGLLAFCRAAYLQGEQPDFAGPGYRLAAQRASERLVLTYYDLPATRYELFEHTPAAICIQRGPTHRYEYVNQAYQALFPGRELIGQDVAAAVPEAVARGSVDRLDHVYQTGETHYGYELPLPASQPDGPPKWRYFNFTCQPAYENGQVTGVTTFAYDVTEQVAARHALETQQQLLATVFEQAPAGLWVVSGPDYVFDLVNPQMARILGRTREQALGRPYFEVLPELFNQGLPELLRQVQQQGEPLHMQELPARLAYHASGEVGYYTFVFQPLRDEQGHVSRIACVALDVTAPVQARQRAEQATATLAEQRHLLQQLVDTVPTAVATFTGPDHRLATFNQVYQRLMNRPLEPGRPLRELLPEAVAQGFGAVMTRVYRTGRAVAQREALLTLRQATAGQHTQHYLNINYEATLDAHGYPAGLLVSLVDVTEQVLARQQVQLLNQDLTTANEALATANEELIATNEELNQSNRQLTRTNADLDTFVYTASHDLKAPIANLDGLLLALRETVPMPADAPTGQLLNMMQASVEHFNLTIQQLTDIARLQQAYHQPAEQVQLAPLVEAVRQDLQPLLEQAGARLHVQAGQEVYFLFPPENLRSVVYNLLSNAVKFHHPDRPPVVHLRAAYVNNTVMLQVQDNGLGLSEHQQQRLFGLFQRLHPHVEGAGIGLYMSKRIVENGNGTITVQSQEGVGSIFTVVLPR